MAFEGRSGQSFIVRRATSLDDLQWVTKLAVEEGSCPRAREAECYFSAGLLSDFMCPRIEFGTQWLASRSHVRTGWLDWLSGTGRRARLSFTTIGYEMVLCRHNGRWGIGHTSKGLAAAQ